MIMARQWLNWYTVTRTSLTHRAEYSPILSAHSPGDAVSSLGKRLLLASGLWSIHPEISMYQDYF